MSRESLELARQVLDGLGNRDADALIAVAEPDVEWHSFFALGRETAFTADMQQRQLTPRGCWMAGRVIRPMSGPLTPIDSDPSADRNFRDKQLIGCVFFPNDRNAGYAALAQNPGALIARIRRDVSNTAPGRAVARRSGPH
jgi:hypothetical protein